jgi:hypothetical protein
MESYTTPAEARRRAVRGLLLQLGGYGQLNTAIILQHLETRGSLLTCENVRARDRAAVNAMVARHNARQEAGSIDWQDEWVWEPTERTEGRNRTLAGEAVARCS